MSKKNNKEMNMIVGADVGNGYTKIKMSVDGDITTVDMPSCVSYVPVSYRWSPVEPTDEYMDELINNLDCEVKSPIIPELDKRRMLVGARAAFVSTSLRQFNIEDHIPKCDDPLAIQLILSSIAAEAVKSYWKKNEALPDASIQVSVDAAVALPFVDYINHRDEYKNKLEGKRHTVNIYNFDASPIAVNIEFSQVTVMPEGAAALYALSSFDKKFMDGAIEVAREDGCDIDDSITGADLLGYENVVGVDLGEGTCAIVNFYQGRLESNSSSINKGYGTVLENVLEATRGTAYEIGSRKELERLLRNENPTPTQKKLQEQMEMLEEEELDTLARDVVAEYKRVIAPFKTEVQVVYAYGGGAGRAKKALYERLVQASEVADGAYIPVLLLNAEYSRVLNRNGLYQIAELAAKNK